MQTNLNALKISILIFSMWGFCSHGELADPLGSVKVFDNSLATPDHSMPDLFSTVEIQIEEVCLGKPGKLPIAMGGVSPILNITPYFAQYSNKDTQFRNGPPLTDGLRLNQFERSTELEAHSGHYIFKDLKVTVTLRDFYDKLVNEDYFESKLDKNGKRISTEFFGAHLSVKSGLSQVIASRWAFNGDNSNRWEAGENASTSRILDKNSEGEFFRLDQLWPNTAVLLGSSRKFITVNDSLLGGHSHTNTVPAACDNTPYIVYSVKTKPSPQS